MKLDKNIYTSLHLSSLLKTRGYSEKRVFNRDDFVLDRPYWVPLINTKEFVLRYAEECLGDENIDFEQRYLSFDIANDICISYVDLFLREPSDVFCDGHSDICVQGDRLALAEHPIAMRILHALQLGRKKIAEEIIEIYATDRKSYFDLIENERKGRNDG